MSPSDESKSPKAQSQEGFNSRKTVESKFEKSIIDQEKSPAIKIPLPDIKNQRNTNNVYLPTQNSIGSGTKKSRPESSSSSRLSHIEFPLDMETRNPKNYSIGRSQVSSGSLPPPVPSPFRTTSPRRKSNNDSPSSPIVEKSPNFVKFSKNDVRHTKLPEKKTLP